MISRFLVLCAALFAFSGDVDASRCELDTDPLDVAFIVDRIAWRVPEYFEVMPEGLATEQLLAELVAGRDVPGRVPDEGTNEGVLARRWYLRAVGSVGT